MRISDWSSDVCSSDLQNFRALQVPDFHGEALYGRSDDTQRHEIHAVTVARAHLCENRVNGKTHLFSHMRFDTWIDIGEGADRPGNGAGCNIGPARDQQLTAASEFGVCFPPFESESHG